MGVHDCDYDAVKTEMGIPTTEPIFVIRAQDALSVPAIARYLNLGIEAELPAKWRREISEVVADFSAWQAQNPTAVKKPD